MARIPLFALVGVLVLVAGCGAERGEDAAVVLGTASAAPSAVATEVAPEVTASSSASPTPLPTSTPEADNEADPVEVLNLATRFSDAYALLDGTSTRVGVAVLTPEGTIYAGGDTAPFELASVVKVPVMIATLERARIEGRSVTSEEQSLLRLMIGSSSNSATDVLWRNAGGAEGVAALIEPLGVTGIDFASDGQWGDSMATATEIVQLLGLLIEDDSPLSADVRRDALDLMESVVADQRWGASAGVDLSDSSDATLAIKNGWYPELGAWLLNSAGVITVFDSAGQPSAHAVVVLTEGASTQTEGVRTIEEIAIAINHDLIPPALAIVPPIRTFDTSSVPPADEDVPDPDGDVEANGTSTPEPDPPAVVLVVFGPSEDVLIPVGGRFIGSGGDQSELTLRYALSPAAADEMLRTYSSSMLQFGWSQVVGPPSLVLSKPDEARWVGVSMSSLGTADRLVEVTISPAPGVLPAGLGSP